MFRHFPRFPANIVLIFASMLPLACSSPDPVAKDLPVEVAPVADVNAPFMVTQSAEPTYTPGKLLTVTATMAYTGTDPITALALQVTLPLGWQFGTLTEGTSPAITPAEGATDTVNMVWIQAPQFPAAVTYTVLVPDWAEGTHSLDAQLIYRALGGEEQSPSHRVNVTAAAA